MLHYYQQEYLLQSLRPKPESATVKFWKEWSNKDAKQKITDAVLGNRGGK
jgi:hypothetical protein